MPWFVINFQKQCSRKNDRVSLHGLVGAERCRHTAPPHGAQVEFYIGIAHVGVLPYPGALESNLSLAMHVALRFLMMTSKDAIGRCSAGAGSGALAFSDVNI